jgi:hypothetical protein
MLTATARSLLEALIRVLHERGWGVDNAHARENWGADWMQPDECTPLDFHGVTTADLLIAIPGSPASGGVHVEIGWASAMGVPVLLLLEQDAEYSHLVRGLDGVPRAEVNEIRYGSPELLPAAVDAWLADHAPRLSPPTGTAAPLLRAG